MSIHFIQLNHSDDLNSTTLPTPVNFKEYDCALFNFVLWGVAGSSLCILGMIGNALSFFSFSKDVKKPAVTLLQCLATSDFFLLAAVFFTDDIPYACGYSNQCENFWSSWPYIRYIWLLTPFSHMSSIWFVVLIACNRYWAVCKPHTMCTSWSMQATHKYIFTVVIIVLFFNSPRFFEYKIVEYNQDIQNETETYLKEERTTFGSSYYYKIIYKTYCVNIILVLVPLFLIILLTIFTLSTLHRKKNSNRGKTSVLNKASQEITLILSLVVIVAILCQTPLSIFHFVRYSYRYGCGDFVFYLDNISKLMITINSCINFCIYCLFSVRFRQTLFDSFTCGHHQRVVIPERPKTFENCSYKLQKIETDNIWNTQSNNFKRMIMMEQVVLFYLVNISKLLWYIYRKCKSCCL